MVNGDLANEASGTDAAEASPAQRRLSSARPDEEAPRGEFWVLLRSVAIVVGFVAVVGWIIG